MLLFSAPPVDPESAKPAPGAVPAAAAHVEKSRPALLGADRAAAIREVEALSLAGGDGALELIADYLEHWTGDAEMQRHGHSALRRLPGDASAIARIVTSDPSANRRAWAAWTAGEHKSAGAADALLAALKDADAKVRLRAVAALGVIGDARAQEPILKMVVHEPDPTTRERAEQALAVLMKPRVEAEPIDALLAALASNDVFARLAAVKELEGKRTDRRAVGPLIDLLSRERDLEVRKHAIGALASMKDEIAVPKLIEIAQADQVDVRTYAIGALAVLDDSRAVEPLATLATKDPSFTIRRYSVRALAMLNRPASLPPVLKALDDSVPDVRGEAVRGLVKLGNVQAGGDALAARLSREGDVSLREFMAVSLGDLGRVGEKKHEDALLALLEDDEARVRAVAAGALGKIGTRRTEKAILRMLEKEKKRKVKDLEVIRIGEDAIRQVHGRTNEGDGG